MTVVPGRQDAAGAPGGRASHAVARAWRRAGGDLALGVLCAAVLVFWWTRIADSWGARYAAPDGIASAVVCGLAVARRWHRAWCAGAGLAVALVAITAAYAATLPSEPGPAMALGSAVLVGSAASALPVRTAAAIAAGGLAVASAGLLTVHVSGVPPVLVLNAAAWLTAIAYASGTRLLESRRRATAARVRAEERRRLARELHDVVGHHLTRIVLQSQAAQILARNPPPDATPRERAVPDTTVREPAVLDTTARDPAVPDAAARERVVPDAAARDPAVPDAAARDPAALDAAARDPAALDAAAREGAVPETAVREIAGSGAAVPRARIRPGSEPAGSEADRSVSGWSGSEGSGSAGSSAVGAARDVHAVGAANGAPVGGGSVPGGVEALAGIEAAGTEALGALRRVVGLLREGGDAGSDVVPRLAELVAAFDGPDVRLEVDDDEGSWPPDVAVAVYRVVQEALTNVVRHAPHARTVTVGVARRGSTLGVEVADDASPGRVRRTGYGLAGMRERVEALGGTVEAGPRDGGGWAVRATLPVRDAR